MNNKSYFLTVFLFGLVVGVSLLALTGAKKVPEANRYQIAAFSAAAGENIVRGWHGYYVIDTKTGEVVDSKVKKVKSVTGKK